MQGSSYRPRPIPALANTTPHTLRRTFISIALIANNFDLKYVMDQVGHADIDVYAQRQKRYKRSHGANFDPSSQRPPSRSRDCPEGTKVTAPNLPSTGVPHPDGI
jgi:hypothetical protein